MRHTRLADFTVIAFLGAAALAPMIAQVPLHETSAPVQVIEAVTVAPVMEAGHAAMVNPVV